MRSTLMAFASLAFMIAAGSASAEKKMFIVASDGGYGVDRCLASGATCGAAAAAAYCKAREFTQALSFRKVDRDDITGAVPTSTGNCKGSNCDEYVAIECSR